MWDSAAANMTNYLLLKERAAAFRADPEVQEAMAHAKVDELRAPDPRRRRGLRAAARRPHPPGRSSTPGAYFGAKGYGFVRLQQLATEHLLGAR